MNPDKQAYFRARELDAMRAAHQADTHRLEDTRATWEAVTYLLAVVTNLEARLAAAERRLPSTPAPKDGTP